MNDIQNGLKTGQKTGPHALKPSHFGLKKGPFCPFLSKKWGLGGLFVPSSIWGFYANYANKGPGPAENPKAFLHATPGRRAGLFKYKSAMSPMGRTEGIPMRFSPLPTAGAPFEVAARGRLDRLSSSRSIRRKHGSIYPTFEIYCNQRWELSSDRVCQLISAAECVISIETIVSILPQCETHVRPLLRLEDQGNRNDVWARVLAANDPRTITAKAVVLGFLKSITAQNCAILRGEK